VFPLLAQTLEELERIDPASIEFLAYIKEHASTHLKPSSLIGSGFTTSCRTLNQFIRKLRIVDEFVSNGGGTKADFIEVLTHQGNERRFAGQIVIDLKSFGFLDEASGNISLTPLGNFILKKYEHERVEEGQASVPKSVLFLRSLAIAEKENIFGIHDSPYYSWETTTAQLLDLISKFNVLPKEDKSLALLNLFSANDFWIAGYGKSFNMARFKDLLLTKLLFKSEALPRLYDILTELISYHRLGAPFSRDSGLTPKQTSLLNLAAPFFSKLMKADSLYPYNYTSNLIRACIIHFSEEARYKIAIPDRGVLPRQPRIKEAARLLVIRVRDAKTPEILKREAHNTCQLCRRAPKISDGIGYVEAAHLVPFRHIDSDGDPGNYLVVCPNHHKNIDKKSFKVLAIDDSSKRFRVKVESVVFGLPAEEQTYTVLPTRSQLANWTSLKKALSEYA